jgi:hypothetical protein
MVKRTLAMLGGALGVASLANAATTVCVTDVAGLQAALSAAEGNTTTTVIEVARGTYNLSGAALTFTSSAAGQGQLDITGGYSADCSTIIENPALTIIDGDSLSGVLSLTSTAGISVRYLTIQNGLKAQNAGLDVTVSGGGIIIDYNIFRNNRATDERSALAASIGGSGNMHIDGNLIVDNTANSNVGGGEVDNLGTGSTYITNNTIANNTITGTLFNGYGGLFVYGSTSPNVSNNIFWGNTNLDFDSTSNPVLVDNDYGTIGGNQSSNTGALNVDPQFSSSSNFHLLPSSPLLGAGTLSPAGGLPTIDVEGHPRSYNGFVDMGAYERGDVIFANNFDD